MNTVLLTGCCSKGSIGLINIIPNGHPTQTLRCCKNTLLFCLMDSYLVVQYRVTLQMT